MAAVNPAADREPSFVAAVVGAAIVSGIAGYFLGMGRSIGLFPFLPAPHDRHLRSSSNKALASDNVDISSASESDSDDDDAGSSDFNTFNDSTEECKLVLLVRTDLGMTKGKIAAQCSHATLACYKALLRTSPGNGLLQRWEKYGQAKVALRVDNEDDMLLLQAQASSLGLCARVIHDAGRTQVVSGSATVLGIGPAPKSDIDRVTGHLRLL